MTGSDVGYRVELTQDLSLCDNGHVVHRGATGMVIGGKADQIVVSWDAAEADVSAVAPEGLRDISRRRR